jgi:hypothetical protein
MDVPSLIDLILERCDAEGLLSPLKTRLVKLLYLTELEYFRRTGKRLTDLKWIFHHFGPYAYALGDLLGNPDDDRVAWSLTRRPSTSDHDMQICVSQVVHEWGNADLNALLDYVYFDTEPMQAATRGEALNFAVVIPLAQKHKEKVRIELDPKKLRELRKKLAARAPDYQRLRVASEVSDDLLENLKEWDIDSALRLNAGQVKVDPKSLM